MDHLFAIILAGGSGTRFWPASRRLRPKQLLAIGPDPERSLLAASVDRVLPLVPKERVLVATGAHLLEATRAALPALPPGSFLGEPAPRNTAACIGWATAIARRRDPEAIVMVLPSDHHVADIPAFHAALERALRAAAAGPITTIGIMPSRPETGYGYIERGEATEEGVHRVVRFVEKPDLARAEEYVASGRYLWNAGMFFFRSDAMLSAIAEHLPTLHAGLERIERAAAQGVDAEARETRIVFGGVEPISIDFGVMEKLRELRVVPASFGWSDLGSWQSAWELSPRDPAGNAVDPGAALLASRGCLVRDLRTDRGPLLVGVGLEDMCLIATDDALLVIPRERAQDVRLAVDALEQGGQRDKL